MGPLVLLDAAGDAEITPTKKSPTIPSVKRIPGATLLLPEKQWGPLAEKATRQRRAARIGMDELGSRRGQPTDSRPLPRRPQ